MSVRFFILFFVDIHHVSKTGSSDNMVLFYLYVDVINSIFKSFIYRNISIFSLIV